MLNFSRWAVAAILFPLVLGVLCAVPSFLPDATVAQLPGFMRTRVNLGLDLAGGSHLLLEASTQDVAKQRLANMEEQVRTELRRGDPRIAIGDISSRDGKLSFMVRDPAQVDAAVERIRPLTQGAGLTGQRDFNVEVVNSSTVTITPTSAGIDAAVKSSMEVATEVIRKRGPWRHLEAVEYATLEWVDWFNHRRLLESNGHVPPAEMEAAYYHQSYGSALAA